MMWHQPRPKQFPWVIVVAIWAAGCTGTPMPIPPSLDPERISLSWLDPELPCPTGECVDLIGDVGATDPAAILIAHRFLYREPSEPRLALARANEQGAFEIQLGGSPEGIFRLVVQGDEGALSLNLEARMELPETPWPVIEREEPPAEICLELEGSALDFGQVSEGETATLTTALRNNCGEPVLLSGLSIVADPEPAASENFWILTQSYELDVGESTPIVVAFWPSALGLYRGALIIEAEIPSMGMPVMLSLPVRGRATLPES